MVARQSTRRRLQRRRSGEHASWASPLGDGTKPASNPYSVPLSLAGGTASWKGPSRKDAVIRRLPIMRGAGERHTIEGSPLRAANGLLPPPQALGVHVQLRACAWKQQSQTTSLDAWWHDRGSMTLCTSDCQGGSLGSAPLHMHGEISSSLSPAVSRQMRQHSASGSTEQGASEGRCAGRSACCASHGATRAALPR